MKTLETAIVDLLENQRFNTRNHYIRVVDQLIYQVDVDLSKDVSTIIDLILAICRKLQTISNGSMQNECFQMGAIQICPLQYQKQKCEEAISQWIVVFEISLQIQKTLYPNKPYGKFKNLNDLFEKMCQLTHIPSLCNKYDNGQVKFFFLFIFLLEKLITSFLRN